MIRCVTYSCMCEHVEEIFVLVESCLLPMATILFDVAKLSYESNIYTTKAQYECLERFVHGKMCSLIYQLREEPMLYQCLAASLHCYLKPSD